MSQTVNGTTTNYTLDLNAGLTQVLADNTTTYLYGLNRIGQSTGTDSAYFLGDALGSVRQMADSTGAVTLSRSYDPYGNVVSSQGSGETDFGYTGEMQQGGLVFLRARYYVTSDGRFLNRDTWRGDYKLPISFNTWLYSYANPNKFSDPTGHNPNCTRGSDICAEARLQEIINGANNNGSEALFRTFEDWELERLWGDAAGKNSRERLEWLLRVTTGSPNNILENIAGPMFHVQMKYYFGDDCGFASEFRDSIFYTPEKWNQQIPDEKERPTNQVGHFLTAVGITYWWVIAGNVASQPNYSHIWPIMGLAAIIGHEMVGDNEKAFVIQQVWKGLMDGSTAFSFWNNAVHFDSQGRYYDRDQELWKILNFDENIEFEDVDPMRVGNSLQDLRLSLKGYRFAYWVHENGKSSPQEAGAWLRGNLSNYLKIQGPSVK